jgi:GWxTD domain-containing protein
MPDRTRPRRASTLRFVLGTLLAALGLWACASAEPRRTRADLTHPFLGPDYSAWLIGPIAAMASPQEIDAYLALSGDAEAREFIDAFWRMRQPANSSTNDALETYRKRCAVADQKFGEGGLLGQRTDRGTVYVLYGPPTATQFQISPAPQDPPIELWAYDAGVPAGLDGKRPEKFYRFIKRGEVTVTYRPTTPRIRPRPFSG